MAVVNDGSVSRQERSPVEIMLDYTLCARLVPSLMSCLASFLIFVFVYLILGLLLILCYS